ncbi:hypothetical protein A6J71_22020 [Enterobacter cancerogenus]|uniref:hypothetical protein n=1 Tax=Enterobacter cancerogenus TaxID=69218 RepID=UPI000C99E31F|nr:hypothetical protein [Enterobacter cancerogenus]PNF12663.1 hypothetical protein A6J71_22020 [Enterobacter cancerogenus]
MHLDQEERASHRGECVAFYWKLLKTKLFYLNNKFISWSTNHNLPGWLGYIPAVLLVLLAILLFILCGIVIAGSALLLAGLVFIGAALVSNSSITKDTKDMGENNPLSSHKPTMEYRTHGDAGSGWYASGIKLEDDD